MSERFNMTHRLLLEITDPRPSKEIVVTEEVSERGARIWARRKYEPGSEGSVELMAARRRVPCRIVWQIAEKNPEGYRETGMIILANIDFWRISFQEALSAKPMEESGPAPPAAVPVAAGDETAELALAIENARAQAGERAMLQLWSSLVEVLEARGVFTRDELVGTLRRIAKS